MKTIYSDQKLPEQHILENSIFLAGPTPRRLDIKSWRPIAINILEELEFDGLVLIPEKRDWKTKFEYDDQIYWEWEAMARCSLVAFWIPRSFPDMPALTTNVEFGFCIGKQDKRTILYGRPNEVEKCKYLDKLYSLYWDYPIFQSLDCLLKQAVVVLK